MAKRKTTTPPAEISPAYSCPCCRAPLRADWTCPRCGVAVPHGLRTERRPSGWLSLRGRSKVTRGLFIAWIRGDQEAFWTLWSLLWAHYYTPLVKFFDILGNEASADVAATAVFEKVLDEIEQAAQSGTFTYETDEGFDAFVKRRMIWRLCDRQRAITREMPQGPPCPLEGGVPRTPGALAPIDVVASAEESPEAALIARESGSSLEGRNAPDDEWDGSDPSGAQRELAYARIGDNDPLSDLDRLAALRALCEGKGQKLLALISWFEEYALTVPPPQRVRRRRSAYVMTNMGISRWAFDCLMRRVRAELPPELRAQAKAYKPRPVQKPEGSVHVLPLPLPRLIQRPRLLAVPAPMPPRIQAYGAA